MINKTAVWVFRQVAFCSIACLNFGIILGKHGRNTGDTHENILLAAVMAVFFTFGFSSDTCPNFTDETERQ